MNILLRRRIRSKEKRRLGKKKSKYKMICYGTGTASQRNPGNFSLREAEWKHCWEGSMGKDKKGKQNLPSFSLAKVHFLDFNFPTLPSWLLDQSGQSLEKLESLSIHSVGLTLQLLWRPHCNGWHDICEEAQTSSPGEGVSNWWW